MIDGHAVQSTSSADQFYYLIVMPGVVAALALGRLLQGAVLPLVTTRAKGYLVSYGWMTILFVMQVQYWHTTRLCTETPLGDILKYSIFFIFPIAVYLAATVLTPSSEQADQLDFRTHYYTHARPFFILCAVGLVAEVLLSYQWECGQMSSGNENLHRYGGVLLAAYLAWRSSDEYELHHQVGVAVGGVLLVVFIGSRLGH